MEKKLLSYHLDQTQKEQTNFIALTAINKEDQETFQDKSKTKTYLEFTGRFLFYLTFVAPR